MESRYLTQSAALRETRQQALAASTAQHEREWNEMAQRWNAGVARFVESVETIQKHCARLFPDWSAADAPSWTPPAETPAAVRFGQVDVRLAKIRGGIPDDPRLKPPATRVHLAAALAAARSFAAGAEGGRDAAGPRRSSRCRLRCCGC